VYAVYRVITALVLSGLLIAILHDDFFYSRLSIPLETMLMHYGYWSFLLLTVDFLLQVKLGTLYPCPRAVSKCLWPVNTGVILDARMFTGRGHG